MTCACVCCVDSWPAAKAWTKENLLKRFGSAMFKTDSYNDDVHCSFVLWNNMYLTLNSITGREDHDEPGQLLHLLGYVNCRFQCTTYAIRA
jgi:hypothetical protein